MPTPILVSPQVRCPSCRNTLIFSLTLLGWPPSLTSLWNQRWLLSGTNADFSPWNQRSLFANLVPKRCNCRSSFVFRRFSVLESASPCGWTAISRILKPQIDSIDQDNFFSHKSSVFIIKVYELLSCWLTINYWQKIWCYVFLYVFACGARVHQPVEGIDFSLKACLEGPIPQTPKNHQFSGILLRVLFQERSE